MDSESMILVRVMLSANVLREYFIHSKHIYGFSNFRHGVYGTIA